MTQPATELVPRGARVLAVGGAADALLEGRDDSSVTRSEAAGLGSLGDERFDVVLLAGVLEHVGDPSGLLREVHPVLADDGAVVASVRNSAHAGVRLALLAGRLDGLLDGGAIRFFTRESLEDLFEESGYVITHWERERVEAGDSALLSHNSIRELLEADRESSTYRFSVRAVPSDAAAQLARVHTELRSARAELDSLRETAAELDGSREELTALRRAHEERGRRIVAERLEFANELTELQRHIDALHRSRSFRYTAPLRNFLGRLRGRR